MPQVQIWLSDTDYAWVLEEARRTGTTPGRVVTSAVNRVRTGSSPSTMKSWHELVKYVEAIQRSQKRAVRIDEVLDMIVWKFLRQNRSVFSDEMPVPVNYEDMYAPVDTEEGQS